ncbi:MAG: DapH/DapD/GlmU-related protein, partial [Candidatus Hodarchaeota archaeon]
MRSQVTRIEEDLMQDNLSLQKDSVVTLQEKIADPGKSYFQKYLELNIGETNIFSFAKYELIITLFGGIPGALGFLLRKFFYKFLLKEAAKNIIWGKHINITGPKRIRIGENCIIGDNSELDAKYDGSEILIGNNVTIGRNSYIRTRGGRIKIADNSAIGANCTLVSRNAVLNIERNHLMGAYCYIGTTHHQYINKKVPIREQDTISKDIFIEEDVWIGARTT